jgi:hypothetical protein
MYTVPFLSFWKWRLPFPRELALRVETICKAYLPGEMLTGKGEFGMGFLLKKTLTEWSPR